jgi:hypothetical protein
VTADDTKEGYFEIIANVAWADVPGPNTKVINTPNKCGKTVLVNGPAATAGTFLNVFGGVDPIPSFTPPALFDAPNTLIGDTYIFDVAAGQGTFAYNATALANFLNAPFLGSLGVDSFPRLSDATDGLAGVNYVLAKAVEYSLYDLNFNGQTTIVNTFPTKRLSILNSPVGGQINGPFNDTATICTDGRIGATGHCATPYDSSDLAARCETVGVAIWDDQENTPSIKGCTFSPCQVKQVTYKKCDEVSLFTIGLTAKAPLNSALVQTPQIDTTGFEMGWVSEDFTTVAGRWTQFPATTNYAYGLPAISYSLQGLIGGVFTQMLPLQYTAESSIGLIQGR